jgi:hypothetical protein
MPIVVDYSPVGDIAHLAFQAGRGRYQQRQQQLALQQQEMAMRDAAQQRSIAANLLSQGIANQQRNAAAQQEMMFRAGMANQQFQQQAALQQQQNDAYQQRADTTGQYGMFRGAMDAIYDLESKGGQYTPEQSKFISELDAARQRAVVDENLDDDGKRAAEMQYWQKRSRVVPTQPPPKTPQQQLDEAVAEYTFPDGTKVPGLLGDRNGAPVFNPIEKPEDEEAKLRAEQEKEARKLQAEQEKAAQAAKLEQEKAAAADLAKRRDRVEDAWDTLQQTINKIDLEVPKVENPKDLEAYNQRREQVKQRMVESFSRRYWKDAVQLAPHIADALGIEELEDLIPPSEQQQPMGEGFQLPALPNGPPPAAPAPAGPAAPAAPAAPAQPPAPEELPAPVQVARQRGVTPALLEKREQELLAKPPEAWTEEDKLNFERIQRLKTQLGMDGPVTVTVGPQGFQQPIPLGF